MADMQEREIDEKTRLDVENFWVEYRSGLGQRQPSEEGEILDFPVETTNNSAYGSVSNNDNTTGGTAVSDTADLPPPTQNICVPDGNIHPDRLLLLNHGGTASPSGVGQVSDQNNDDSMQAKPKFAAGPARKQAHNPANLNQPTPSFPIPYNNVNLLASMKPLPEDRKRAISSAAAAAAATRIKRGKSSSSTAPHSTHRRGKKRHRNNNPPSPGGPPSRRKKLERAAKPICVPCLIDRPDQPCDHTNECANCRRGSASFSNTGARNQRQVCYYEACLDGRGCADTGCAKLHPDQCGGDQRVWKISEPAVECNDQIVVVVRHKPPPFWGMWEADYFPSSSPSSEKKIKVEEVEEMDY